MKRLYLFMTLMAAMMLTAVSTHAAKVYFIGPDGWTTVKAYIYKGSTVHVTWPGTDMTKEAGDAVWSIDVPAAYETGNIIFNNGNGSQYPATTGLALKEVDMVCSYDSSDATNSIWTPYNAAAITVQFDNTDSAWANPTVYSWGTNGKAAAWPGTALSNPVGNVYTVTLPAGTCGVIFNDGTANGEQSPNFAAVDGTTYTKTSSSSGSSGPAPEAFTVYFDNSGKNWAQPKVHYFGGDETSTWPGVNMTLDSGTIYKYTVPAGTTGVVFNDGNGNQLSDITPIANHLYDGNGTDKGEYTSGSGAVVETPSALYILGTVGDTFWATTPGIAMTKNGDKFTATGVEIKASKAGASFGYFTFVTAVGADWDAVNASDRFGAASENEELADATATAMTKYTKNVNASAAQSWAVAPGTYDIEADFSPANPTVKATLKSSGPEAGTGALAVTPVTVNPGRDATIEISISDASKVMTALQLDVEMPEGISAGAPLISRNMGSHTLTSKVLTNGKLRIVIYSESNTPFTSTTGALLYLPITASTSIAEGTKTITLSNITFADADLMAVNLDPIEANVITVAKASDYTITLNKTVLALSPGESFQLNAEVKPHDGTDENYTWSSSNSDVATVSANGKVTAMANGSADITVDCKGATAICTVYVGKQSQTITWNQVIGQLGVGEADVALTATASSGLDVTYAITAGSAYASIVDGKLHAIAAGIVTITASQAGDGTYAPAEPVSKTVTIWLGYIEGDADGDGEITLADAVTTVNYILENNPDPFNAAAADVNGDGVINVADVALIVDKVLKAQAPAGAPRRIGAAAAAVEETEQFKVESGTYVLYVTFSNQQNYVASIFDITLPEGVEIKDASIMGSNHAVVTHKLSATTTRVAAYSTTNELFAPDGFMTLNLNAPTVADYRLFNASICRTDGVTTVQLQGIGAEGGAASIGNIGADAAAPVYYNLQGIRVNNPAGGVFVRIAGGNAEKVLVK